MVTSLRPQDKHRWLVGLAVLIIALTLTGSCAPRAAKTSGTTTDSYTIAYMDAGPPTPFSDIQHSGPHYLVSSFVFDSLVWQTERGIVPWLAEHYTESPDHLNWTFVLRPGLRWQDGTTLTAHDVAFSFNYLKQHPLGTNAVLLSRYVQQVEAVDDRTVVVRLTQPFVDFLSQLVIWVPIFPRHVWQQVADPGSFTDQKAYIGSGPYRVVEYRRGEYLVLAANPGYFLGPPRVKRLVIRFPTDAALALRAGQVDAAGLDARVAKEFRAMSGFQVSAERPSYFYLKLLFNNQRYPASERDFRLAVAYAVNRQELIDRFAGGGGVLANPGTLHPESPWYDKHVAGYPPDPAKARALLQGLGFKPGTDGVLADASGRRLAFPLLCRTAKNARACEVIKDQLAQVGIQVAVQVLDTGPMEQRIGKGDFVLAVDGHGGTLRFFPNPDFPAQTYQSQEYKQLYGQFLTASDPAVRLAVARRIQALLAHDLPALPLFFPTQALVTRKGTTVDWFWTPQGVAGGIPSWWNKAALVASPSLTRARHRDTNLATAAEPVTSTATRARLGQEASGPWPRG